MLKTSKHQPLSFPLVARVQVTTTRTLELVAPLPVMMLDEPIHTDDHPFCSDALCPCHLDTDLYQEHIEMPRRAGLLTAYEALRKFYGCHI